MRWQVHGQRTLYRDSWLRLALADVELPDGRRIDHRLITFADGAHVIAVQRDRVLLLWRHRFITDAWGWEIPGGAVAAGENPAAAAARELEEETGWRPDGPLRPLLQAHPMPGLATVRHHVFQASSVTCAGPPTDTTEAERVAWVPLAEIRGLIGKGDIVEATTQAALLTVLAERS